MHRCTTCQTTFKSGPAFEAHDCVKQLEAANMSMDELMALYNKQKQMTLKVGKKSYPVAGYKEASEMCAAARDQSGVGSSQWRNPGLFVDGKQVAYVSYNCRVWKGTAYVAGAEPLYCPR